MDWHLWLTSSLEMFAQLRWQDFIDMILVWIIVYKILILIKKTGTIQILSGLGFLAILFILSHHLELFTFNFLLEKFFSHLFLILVILFQAEIRRALAQIGANPFFSDVSTIQETQVIEELVKASYAMAQKGLGALIVLEKEIMVDFHIELGTEVDGAVSHQLLESIFLPSSPIHDGAVLIRGGKIHSAGNFLPLSKNPVLDKNLGTRHRAAIGLSEETDALIILVSEENKSVSLVQGGILTPVYEMGDLRKELYEVYGLRFKPAED